MQQSTEINPDSETPAMKRVVKCSALVSVGVNLVLTAMQLVANILAHSQALIADAIHSLSGLVSDFVVFSAGHHSQKEPDAEHHYGHLRSGTAASPVLGLLLLTVGVGMLWDTVTKLGHPESISHVKLAGLWVALGILVSKGLLFRYMLAVVERAHSSMLIASAWHARSDVASSLVVALGIVGDLLGFHLLDPVATFIAGLMVAGMDWQFGSNTLHDFMNRTVNQGTVGETREVIPGTSDVLGVHNMRIYRTGDMVLVGTHLEIESAATVKAGHDITLEVRRRVMQRHDVLNIMAHVDPVSGLSADTS